MRVFSMIAVCVLGVAACGDSGGSGAGGAGTTGTGGAGTGAATTSAGGAGTGGTTTSAGGAGTGGAGTGGAGGGSAAACGTVKDPNACDAPLMSGTPIQATNIASLPDGSAMIGGTILNGDYVLEAVTGYGANPIGPTGTFKTVIGFCDGAVARHALVFINGVEQGNSFEADTFTTAGNQITLAKTCVGTLGTQTRFYSVEENGDVYRELILQGPDAVETKYRRQ